MASDVEIFEPGMYVRHPDRPDWGIGQVQSSVPGRITVMFENAGRVVIDSKNVQLQMLAGM